MPFQLTLYCGVLVLSALISALVASVAWQRRGATLPRTYFSLMMLGATFYAAAAALEAGVVKLSDKIFWSTVEYLGSGAVVVFFLLFAHAFTYDNWRFSYRHITHACLLPLFNFTLVATNSLHHLVWVAVTPASGSNNLAIYEHGIGYFWIVGSVYLYVLRGIQVLARSAFNGSELKRKQAALLIVGSLFPFISSALYSLKLLPHGLNITPMSFMATGLFFCWVLFRMGAFDALPIAREMLIEQLQDGVVVVDAKHRIVDINNKGRSLINLTGEWIGRSIASALEAFPEFLQYYQDCNEKHFLTAPLELWLNPDCPRYVSVQISPLADFQGSLHGWLIVLHDITERYQAEVELRQMNDCLRSQLQRIEFLQGKLQHQAKRDQLTGLFNRHHLNEVLPQELKRAKLTGYPIGLIMLDIDHFKRVNDTFGHRMGDRVLEAFSDIISHHIRAVDIPCRLGGEEFLLILPGSSLISAYQRAEEIRKAFRDSAIVLADAEVRTTVSGGIAVFPEHGTNYDDLLHAADSALYAAKNAGRDRVVAATPDPVAKSTCS